MAAAVTTSATTIEAQVFEVVQNMQLLELAIPEDTRPNQVTIDPDTEAQTVTMTVTVPITNTIGAGGKMETSAGEYL
ncbi:MAG: hypothetical protein F6K61_21550 [Sphaerospermopsis sp. SIO1G1]|nr:hypothetical protein [Sphaerospermopsis sp. SIO1G1]